MNREYQTLKQLKGEMNQIASSWNGKEPGAEENDALLAGEVIVHIDEIESKLKRLSQ